MTAPKDVKASEAAAVAGAIAVAAQPGATRPAEVHARFGPGSDGPMPPLRDLAPPGETQEEYWNRIHGEAERAQALGDAPESCVVEMAVRQPDVRPLRALQETVTLGRLYAALAEARDAADSVLKASTARVKTEKGEFSYAYASADHIVAVARDALRGTGLVVIPIDWRTRRLAAVPMDVLDRVLRLAHESGEFMDVELLDWPVLPGGGGRDFAKALGVALTSSFGYFQRDLLGLPRLASDDMDAQETRAQRHRERGEPEDQTPAPAVAETLTARGKAVVAKLDGVRDVATLRDRWEWFRNEKAAEETAPARRYSDADLKAIEEKLNALLPRVEQPDEVVDAAPEAAADAAPPDDVQAAPVAPPVASPPGANVAPATKPAAGSRPAAPRRRNGAGGLPGME